MAQASVLLLSCIALQFLAWPTANAALVPALFIFGDSLVDAGNNNALLTLAQANFAPYGKDFYNRQPTGRFANGNLVPDFLAIKLGLPFSPAYLQAGEDVLHGVNFASAGSGLLESTGTVFGEHVSIPKQVDNFVKVKSHIASKVGVAKASEIVSQAIYYITVGSNDIVNNYYLLTPVPSPLSKQYTPRQFQDLLISVYQQQIQRLYAEGARKFILVSVTALGCSPINLLRYNVVGQGNCVDFLNEAAFNYNAALKASVSKWNSALPGAHIVYGNSYEYVLQLVKSPTSYGYQVSDKACCSGIGKNGAIVFCLREVPTCSNTSAYVYWDEFHPSSRVYGEVAELFWSGSQAYSYPINVKQLARQ